MVKEGCFTAPSNVISYCKTRGLGDYRSLHFTVKGSGVRGSQTARELRLKIGSVMDAWTEEIGGALLLFVSNFCLVQY